ncbi:DUF6442 family protein [Bacillus sp. NH11B]|uniref:DUF6442 family protein n=1 Tax=Bacillus sp. NH11B TaxID=1866314 RepID=UPI0008FDD267|nr:DUF6442 family protein [Bacillus sp. NH11B]OJD62303.1 hypothetical protein BAU27_11550 [Bacillus sp. NH11B]
MQKEEILRKYKKMGRDERKELIELDSSSYGLIAVLVLVLFFGSWKLMHGIKSYELISIFAGYIASTSFYKFRKLKEQRFLIASILAIMSTIAGAIVFFLEG